MLKLDFTSTYHNDPEFPSGRHAGQRVSKVPTDHLKWALKWGEFHPNFLRVLEIELDARGALK